MMQSGSRARIGADILFVAALGMAVSACSKQPESAGTTAETTTAATTETAAPAATETADANSMASATPAAAPAAAAPAPDNTDTLTGVKLASYTGDAAKGKVAFITCQTCHSIEAGVNKIGPSLHAVVGRKAGEVPGFTYTAANKDSGITWTPEKLFQYLEKPQRVVPGTKMTFPGFPEPQKRADVIAYLQSNS